MADDPQLERLAEQLRKEADTIVFPPTPDIGDRNRVRSVGVPWYQRRGARVTFVAALLVAALLLAVPEVRAAALRVLQIGVVSVFIAPETSTPMPTVVPQPTALSFTPTALPSKPDLGLTGLTTLELARSAIDFPLLLPSYPPDLGPPDLVYLQNLDGAAVVLVWLDPANPARPRLSLHTLTSDVFVRKTLASDETRYIAEIRVNDVDALWISAPHLVETGRAGELSSVRLVDGNTLIWSENGLTYRLETDLAVDEAEQIAESLRSVE